MGCPRRYASVSGSVRMVFRIGNQSSLTSHAALSVPINKLGLCVKIAVVDGGTPGAVIDTGRQEITFKKTLKTVPVQLSNRNLIAMTSCHMT